MTKFFVLNFIDVKLCLSQRVFVVLIFAQISFLVVEPNQIFFGGKSLQGGQSVLEKGLLQLSCLIYY